MTKTWISCTIHSIGMKTDWLMACGGMKVLPEYVVIVYSVNVSNVSCITYILTHLSANHNCSRQHKS